MVEQTSQEIPNGIKISVVDLPKTTAEARPSNKENATCPEKKDEKKSGDAHQPYMTMFIAELIGTALLMFLGCMGVVNNYNEPTPTHHLGGTTFGLTVMLIIQIFGHISGAHLNPAVTMATVFFGILKPAMGVVYIVAQFVGAILGFGLLKILISEAYAPEGFCATTVNENLSVVQALGIEIVITTVLIFICCGVWDKRNVTKADSVPLRFGFAIAAISMAAGPLTGASMNTARSFAPLVYGGSWQHHWIYWVGPNVAPLIGCGIYKFLFNAPETVESRRESVYLNEVSHQPAEKV